MNCLSRIPSLCRPLLSSVVLLVSAGVMAEEEAEGMGAGAPDTIATVATLGLGLLAVIAVIFISAWGIRRVQGMGGVNSQAMKVVAVLSVGQRERVALIDVGEKQILIGITPQSVRTLHVFDEPVVKPSAPGAGGDFASRLQQVLGRSGQPTGDKQ